MAAVAAKPAKVPPGFARRQIKVNGADVVLFEGGSGEPLLFLHGAGTVSGFNFSASWARKFKVYLPYHPGFGESADSAAITSIDDYEMARFARLAWERPYDPNLPKWLHRIGVPTLLLYGDHDRITPAQQAATWAGLIPGAVVHIVKDAGHRVLDEQEEGPQVVLD